ERRVLVPATDRGALRAAAALAGKQKAHSLTFFDGFGLNAAITRAIAEAKHGALGQIQEQTILIAMSRRDAICTAQTGAQERPPSSPRRSCNTSLRTSGPPTQPNEFSRR